MFKASGAYCFAALNNLLCALVAAAEGRPVDGAAGLDVAAMAAPAQTSSQASWSAEGPNVGTLLRVRSNFFASPKSMSFAVGLESSPVIRQLSALMSRWRTPTRSRYLRNAITGRTPVMHEGEKGLVQ